MYAESWIRLDGERTISSSWIQAFTWRTRNEENAEEPNCKGVLNVRIQQENDEKVSEFAYNEVPRRVFERLKDEAYNGESVGSVFSQYVKHNDDIPPATKKE